MIDLSHLEDWAWEREYLTEISRSVPEINAVAVHWWSKRRTHRWWPDALPVYRRRQLIVPDELDGDTVLIILSDELYRIPEKTSALAVFKQYVKQTDRISIPFPLGFRSGFPQLTVRPLEDRAIDIGFIGRSYSHRRAFLKRLKSHPQLKRYRLELNSEGGASISDYAEFLNNTKVSICLPGNSSPETSRYYESVKSGCVAVSARMPENALYQAHPGFQIDNINDVDAVATLLCSILDAPAQYDALQHRALAAWDEQYSPAAMGRMMLATVRSKDIAK